MDSDTLQGQTALVTGATNGIGRATAKALAGAGADVLVHGRDTGRGAEVVAELEATGASARFIAAELSDPGQVRNLAASAGEVDILVNNGGLSAFGPTAELEPDRYAEMFAANVQAAFLLVAALAPGMADRGRGAIVTVSSMAGRIVDVRSPSHPLQNHRTLRPDAETTPVKPDLNEPQVPQVQASRSWTASPPIMRLSGAHGAADRRSFARAVLSVT